LHISKFDLYLGDLEVSVQEKYHYVLQHELQRYVLEYGYKLYVFHPNLISQK